MQSLILASILVSAGGLLLLAAVLADLSAANRALLEDLRVRLRELELGALGTRSGESVGSDERPSGRASSVEKPRRTRP